MQRLCLLMLMSSLLVPAAFADTPQEFLEQETVFPVTFQDVDNLFFLSAGEVYIPDALELFDGLPCFGFTPDVKMSNDGTNNVLVSSWCEGGGWTTPGRSGVSRWTLGGELVAFASVQDAGQDPMGHGLGWAVGSFPGGNVVAAGPGIVQDLDFLEWPVNAIRFFDADLIPLTPLVSAAEPENLAGNDERDCHFTGCPTGEAFYRSRITTLESGDKCVYAWMFASAEAQKFVGLTDPNPDLDDNDNDGIADLPPGGKLYFRIFNSDGTPAGPTKLAVMPEEGNDAANWAKVQAHVDVAPRTGGGFFLVGQGLPNIGEDSQPIYRFDADGNLEDAISVVEPSLFPFQGGFPPAELAQGGGIVSLASAINLPEYGAQQWALSMFRENEGGDGGGAGQAVTHVRRTFNIFRQHALSPIRESEIAADGRGNIAALTRGQYFDSTPERNPVGPDDQDDMQTVVLIDNQGQYLDGGPAWVPYDEPGYPGSQRDPILDINDFGMAFAYLSNAPREVDGQNVNTFGGVNVVTMFNNPFHAGPMNRGDCNDDGGIDVSDGVAVLNFSFLGADTPGCLAACDFNDNGALDITNAVYFFNALFQGGPPIAAPTGECGLASSAASRLLTGCLNFSMGCGP